MLPNLREGWRNGLVLSCQDEAHTQPQACPRHPEWPPSLAWEVSHGLQYLLLPSPAAVPSLWAAGSDWWSRSHATLHAGKEHGSHLRHGSVNVKSIFLQKSYQRWGVGGQREGRVSHTLPLQRRWEDERQWLRTLESNTFIIPRFRPLLFPPWLPRSRLCPSSPTKALSRRGDKGGSEGGGGGGTPLLEKQCGHE